MKYIATSFTAISIPLAFQINRKSILEIFTSYGAIKPVVFERDSVPFDRVSVAFNADTELTSEQIQSLEKDIFAKSGVLVEAVDALSINRLYRDLVLSLARAI